MVFIFRNLDAGGRFATTLVARVILDARRGKHTGISRFRWGPASGRCGVALCVSNPAPPLMGETDFSDEAGAASAIKRNGLPVAFYGN